MSARLRPFLAIQETLERETHRTTAEHIAEREAAWKARVEAINAAFAEERRYETDAEYRTEQDADQARRQAQVYAAMDACIERARARRNREQGEEA